LLRILWNNTSMDKIIEFTKSKKIIILTLVSLSFLIFVVIKINFNKQNPTTIEAPISSPVDKIATFDEIIPGKTSIERINELLGKPLDSIASGGLNISNYKSTNQYRNHKVYSKDGLAELIIEEIIGESKTANDVRKIYGIAPEMLYEKTLSSVFNLYVYPSNGIAYLGHEDGTILEVWYFVPTTIEDFIIKWGSDYSKEPSKEIPKY